MRTSFITLDSSWDCFLTNTRCSLVQSMWVSCKLCSWGSNHHEDIPAHLHLPTTISGLYGRSNIGHIMFQHIWHNVKSKHVIYMLANNKVIIIEFRHFKVSILESHYASFCHPLPFPDDFLRKRTHKSLLEYRFFAQRFVSHQLPPKQKWKCPCSVSIYFLTPKILTFKLDR